MILQSPAKINTILKVLGKRQDGYHEIFSIMQAVSFFDTITIKLAAKDTFTCSDATLRMDAANLVVKAVELFRKTTNIDQPLSIHLEKRIPQGAGLGGGSSNAATTLFGLNELFNTQLDLLSLGACLGSDVPFFFSLGTSACFGRGEKLHFLEPMLTQSCYLYFPHLFCSTKEVYQVFQQSCNDWDPQRILSNYQIGKQEFFNDLQPCALKVQNALVKHLDSLLSCGISHFLMTGSGSTIVIYEHVEEFLANKLQLLKVNFIRRQHHQWY